VLIEAAAQPPLARLENLVVILAGDAQGRDDYRAGLEHLIAARGLAKRVRLVGHCEDAPAALALAGVAVVASTEPEAFGRTAMEAASMGAPVVATCLGATEETVLAPPLVSASERTGWLVAPGDAAALADAVHQALSLTRRERDALSRRAREHSQNFTTAAMQSATLALYDRLVDAVRSSRSFPETITPPAS